jgi:hypothetical protein
MKQINLTQSQIALVDDEDYEKVKSHKWCAVKSCKTYYALTSTFKNGKSVSMKMHRFLIGREDCEIDHINRIGTDNRRENLRICNSSQNKMNSSPRIGTSACKGVHLDSSRKLWIAKIQKDYKSIFIGRFKNEIEAANSYDKKAKELFGEFAYLNKKNAGLVIRKDPDGI